MKNESTSRGREGTIERALRLEISKRLEAEGVIRKQAAALTHARRLLLSEPALPDFIRALLAMITRECGGVWTTLWKVDEPQSGGNRKSFSWMDTTTRERVESFVTAHPVAMRRLGRLYEGLLRDHQCTIVLSAEDARQPRVVQRFYRQMKVRAALITPFMMKDKLLGWISHLSFSQPARIHRDHVAFIEAAAQQATLAIQMAHLANAAGSAREAREREMRTAGEAREAREINHLLRIGFDPDRPPSVGIMETALANGIRLSGAVWGALWRCGRDGGPATPVCEGDQEGVTWVDEVAAIQRGCMARERHPRFIRRWEGMSESASVHCRSRCWKSLLRSLGAPADVRGRLNVLPLRFDDENVGFILALHDKQVETSSARSIAMQALAIHAALALRLEALSEVERSAAISRERTRISRDLHDVLAQSFSGIALQVEAMRAGFPNLPAPVAARLERVREVAVRSVDDMRRALQMLKPAVLDRRSLADALRELALSAEPPVGKRVEFVGTVDRLDPGSRREIHLFAIASEALQNALAHSRHGVVTLGIARRGGDLEVFVESPGGMRKRRRADPRPHYGMENMRNRAASIGGTLSVENRDGRLRVAARVPLSDDTRSA